MISEKGIYKKMQLGSDHKPPWQRLTPHAFRVVEKCDPDSMLFPAIYVRHGSIAFVTQVKFTIF